MATFPEFLAEQLAAVHTRVCEEHARRTGDRSGDITPLPGSPRIVLSPRRFQNSLYSNGSPRSLTALSLPSRSDIEPAVPMEHTSGDVKILSSTTQHGANPPDATTPDAATQESLKAAGDERKEKKRRSQVSWTSATTPKTLVNLDHTANTVDDKVNGLDILDENFERGVSYGSSMDSPAIVCSGLPERLNSQFTSSDQPGLQHGSTWDVLERNPTPDGLQSTEIAQQMTNAVTLSEKAVTVGSSTPASPRERFKANLSMQSKRSAKSVQSPRARAFIQAFEEAITSENVRHHFKLAKCWHIENTKTNNVSLLCKLVRSKSQDLRPELSDAGSVAMEEPEEQPTCFGIFWRRLVSPFVLHPNSKKRLNWDLIGMLLITYDIIMIPLGIFELGPHLVYNIVAWISLIFWTCDLPSCFAVGFHTGGHLIMNPVAIARHYAVGWLSLDVLLVTIDWSILLLGDDDNEADDVESLGLARLGKAMRVVRVLRILRLLRLIKLPKYFLLMEEHLQSESATVAVGITKLTASILVLNHFIACMWYGVGQFDVLKSDGEIGTWVDVAGLTNATLSYKYATSLHWSLTQFTPASMEVTPGNVRERYFTIVVLVFALVTFSSFVSSITNAMTRLRNMNSEFEKQLIIFQRYIRHNKISTELTVRMRKHLQCKILHAKNVFEEKDVELLHLLSDPLRMELHMETFRPILDHDAFFHCYGQKNPVAMRKLCHTALGNVGLSAGDILFSSGESCSRMFFVKEGKIFYTSQFNVDNEFETLDSKERIHSLCEGSLWTTWLHCGTALAASESNITYIDVARFQECEHTSKSLMVMPGKYAAAFVNHLNTLAIQDVTDLDLEDFDSETALGLACGGERDEMGCDSKGFYTFSGRPSEITRLDDFNK